MAGRNLSSIIFYDLMYMRNFPFGFADSLIRRWRKTIKQILSFMKGKNENIFKINKVLEYFFIYRS